VFLEKMKIASACNKFLRRKFLKPERIGLIPVGATLTIESKVRKPWPGCYLKKKEIGQIIY